MSGLAYVKSARPFTPAEITVGALLRDAAVEAPGATALATLRDPDGTRQSLTYADLLARAEAVAQDLMTRFAPGDRLVIWAGNRLDWTVTQFGAAMAGLIVVAINPGCAKGELRYFLDQSQARGIVMERGNRGRDQMALLDELRTELPTLEHVIDLDDWTLAPGNAPLPLVKPSDPALIQYTSGTTGKPKGALLTHRGLVNATKSSAQTFGLAAGSTWLNTVPMYTTSGAVFVTMMAMWNRGRQLMLPGFDPELVCRAVDEDGANFMPLVPTMALAVLNHPGRAGRDFSALDTVVIGGSAIAPSLVTRVDAELGAEVFVIFGQTEACSTLCLTSRGDSIERKTTTVGYPIAGTEIRIVDPVTGQTVKTGEIGEICARGPSIMSGYFRMPDQTAEALDPEGWLRTGDLGRMDEDGYPWITGRLKEMIIRGGSNIYPREIEDILIEMPGVTEAAVFGIPDEHYGETAVAAVRLAPGAEVDEAAILAHLGEHVARYKVPGAVWVVDAFPLTASGKVQKFELRNRYLSTR
ncbi:MAG: class I adenylate-forming enzyme family protein [Sagittula sp.]|uniref:class I adenylate-forming enzyme family protein n=1 Tax=Sagittula sp. TaxID=2038081 RepID=UPI004058371F